MRNDCIVRFKMMRQELRNELQSLNSRICLTSDLWTSNQKLGYLCLTAHYIDANFILKKKTIAFKDVKYPHTGLAIEEVITKCLIEWGIKEKVFTITLDNASNNQSACDLLRESGRSDMLFGGEHLHVRCCAHILNLLVQDGMAIAHGAIDKIRDLVRHIISSPSRIQAFNEIAERSGLSSKAGLILDVPNRWNSTHNMIMEAIEYKVVLKRYTEEQLEPSPDDEEWTNSEAIGEFLGAFEEATKAFSAHRSPTSHLFLHNVLCIHQALRNENWQINCVLEDLALAMDSKFDKY
ncbi:Zinc finger BED domain-containing protein DAYSLEEPER [Zea mays]|nr:Zinc finger BED domain-containing protein DAYSLEEPER [Zea mays]